MESILLAGILRELLCFLTYLEDDCHTYLPKQLIYSHVKLSWYHAIEGKISIFHKFA